MCSYTDFWVKYDAEFHEYKRLIGFCVGDGHFFFIILLTVPVFFSSFANWHSFSWLHSLLSFFLFASIFISLSVILLFVFFSSSILSFSFSVCACVRVCQCLMIRPHLYPIIATLAFSPQNKTLLITKKGHFSTSLSFTILSVSLSLLHFSRLRLFNDLLRPWHLAFSKNWTLFFCFFFLLTNERFLLQQTNFTISQSVVNIASPKYKERLFFFLFLRLSTVDPTFTSVEIVHILSHIFFSFSPFTQVKLLLIFGYYYQDKQTPYLFLSINLNITCCFFLKCHG